MTAKEFVDFWLKNSVHPDEQLQPRRQREEIDLLVDNLVIAANAQGFTKEAIEAEIGDIFAFIKAKIDEENEQETKRLRSDKG